MNTNVKINISITLSPEAHLKDKSYYNNNYYKLSSNCVLPYPLQGCNCIFEHCYEEYPSYNYTFGVISEGPDGEFVEKYYIPSLQDDEIIDGTITFSLDRVSTDRTACHA